MGRTMTIVAAPPNDGKVYKADSAIEAVLAAISREITPEHTIERASSVEGLSLLLARDLEKSGPLDLLQIVGHGRTGLLFLGMTWTSEMEGVGLINSDPGVYGVLDRCVDRSTRVMLLGCDVGVMTNERTSEVADGPTLLFDLSRMWSCEVSAPDEPVSAEDFVGGVFIHPDRLVRASGLSVFPPTRKPDASWKMGGIGASRA